MKNPLLFLASCFALGILIAHLLLPGFAALPFLLAAAAGCLLCGLIFLRGGRTRISGGFVLAGFVLAGIASTVSFQNRFLPNDIHNLAGWGLNLERPVKAEGIIVTNPIRGHNSFRFDLECRRIERARHWRKVQGKVQVRIFVPANTRSWKAADALDLRYGDLVRAPVRFEKPMVYRNPGSFDFRGWLEDVKDISWEGDIKSPLSVQKLANAQASPLSMLVATVRVRLLRGIDQLYPSWSSKGRVGAVLKAILLGDRSSLDSSTVENFRQSGLYHLLVISGLHVGLLAAVLLFFLRFLGVRESWRMLCLLMFLGGYALLVEQRAPTLRASLMIGAYLITRYLYRDRAALNAVGLAALVLLFHRPAWLFEAGFDLSFSAALLIAGLAIPILERTTVPYWSALSGLNRVERDTNLAPRMAQLRLDLRAVIAWLKARFSFLGRHPAISEHLVAGPLRIGLWIADLILFSAIIQIGLFMPMAETFHRITVAGIGLNAIALPLMTLLIALAVPTVILAATVPFLAALPAKLLFWVTSALIAVTEFRGEPFWMSYRIPGPPMWVAVGFALALLAVAFFLGRNNRLLVCSVVTFTLFSIVVISYPFPPRTPKETLQVTALDCGRGEALFTVLPDGTTLLVDAGGREHFGPDFGRWNPGEEIVSPYLWSRGIKRIDIAVLGDGSDENIKAMEVILRNFRVHELWRGPAVRNSEYITLAGTARERGVKIREIAAGDLKVQSEARIRVLWPPYVLPHARLPHSDRSPVLRISDELGNVLLRCNTDDRIERILAKSGLNLSSAVLESARPLSEMNSQKEFIARVNPRVVLDTGRNGKRREHEDPPHLMVRSFANVPVFQTSSDGAVTIDMKKSSLSVRCYGSPTEFNWHRSM